MAFIDLSKAFDTMDRAILWKTLSKFGFPPIFLAILRDFHDDMSAQVIYGGASSEFFSSAGWCQTGLRAGTCHLQHLHDCCRTICLQFFPPRQWDLRQVSP